MCEVHPCAPENNHFSSECHSPIVNSKKIKRHSTLSDVCLPELLFFRVFNMSVGTLHEVNHCDCRHVCDDEESNHEDFDENDHVHEDHENHC